MAAGALAHPEVIIYPFLNEDSSMANRKPKTVKFNEEGIKKLPKDKPVVYKILNSDNKNIYTGSAKRGRIVQRLKEHLAGRADPIKGGQRVRIQQKLSISEAQQLEANIIKSSKPRYNKIGK